jgi:ribosomal protein L37AE/L43A
MSIKDRIQALYKPTLDIIEMCSNCEHDWLDKNGSSTFICRKCNYACSDSQLDKLIFEDKLRKKDMMKKLLKD